MSQSLVVFFKNIGQKYACIIFWCKRLKTNHNLQFLILLVSAIGLFFSTERDRAGSVIVRDRHFKTWCMRLMTTKVMVLIPLRPENKKPNDESKSTPIVKKEKHIKTW